MAGLFHGAGWVYPGSWPMVWIGHVCLILLPAICTPRKAFLSGLAIGCIGLGWSFAWAPEALAMCFDASWWAANAIYAVLVAWESIQLGLFCWLTAVVMRSGVRGMFAVPFAWGAIEYWWPKIFPWMLGYTQLEIVPLLQIAELTGPIGIGFVLTAAAAIPAACLLWRSAPDRRAESKWLWGYAVSSWLLLTLVLGYGHARISQLRERLVDAPKSRVAVVQIDPSKMGSVEKMREQTAALQAPVDLVCWPESAIGTYEDQLNDLRDPDRTMLHSRESRDSLRPAEGFRCDLLAGGRTYSAGTPDEGPYFMSAYLINSQEQVIGRYHKRTLLPFGEYIPGQDHYPEIRRWATLHEVIGAGQDARPLTTSTGVRIGVVICYEDLLPRNVRETVAAGADVLVSLINATAFEHPLTLDQHERIARLRAVENRKCFVRCSSTGITCVVSPTGEVVANLDKGIEATLVHDLPIIEGQTPYTRWGDFFPWLCTLVVAGWLKRLVSRQTPVQKANLSQGASTVCGS
jgi:apolipoprotein N-acyltransferase